MDIRVAGHQVDTGEALRTPCRRPARTRSPTNISAARSPPTSPSGAGRMTSFTCDIVAPVAQGMVLKASNRADDAHVAFDGAATKIERQLKRYMSRLRERTQRRCAASTTMPPTPCSRRRRGDEAPPEAPADRRRNPRRHSRSQRVRRGDDARPAQHQCADVPQQRQRRRSTWSIAGTTARSAGSNRRPSDKRPAVRRNGRSTIGARRSAPVSQSAVVMILSQFLDFEAIRRRPRASTTSASCSTSWRRSPASAWRSIRRAITDAIAERERLGSTGFGGGVAIPHGKLDGLDRVYALVGAAGDAGRL